MTLTTNTPVNFKIPLSETGTFCFAYWRFKYPREKSPVKLNAQFWEDTRVLGNAEEGRPTLPDQLFPGHTLSGAVFKTLLLAQPTISSAAIRSRQKQIKSLMRRPSASRKQTRDTLKSLAASEVYMIALFDELDPIHSSDVQDLVERYGSRSPLQKAIDKAMHAVTSGDELLTYVAYNCKRAVLFMSPLQLPEYISKEFAYTAGSSLFLLSSDYYMDTIEAEYKEAVRLQHRVLYKNIRSVVDGLRDFLTSALTLSDLSDLPEGLALTFTPEEQRSLEAFCQSVDWLMTSDRYSEHENYLSDVAESLWQVLELKPVIRRIVFQMASLDAFQAIAERMIHDQQPFSDTRRPGLSFVTINRHHSSQKPFIRATAFWNPMLDAGEAVPNSLSLGEAQQRQRVCPASGWMRPVDTCEALPETVPKVLILSGSNASGKSTLIRAVTLNTLMAQTLGIVAAETYEASLFDSLHSHMDKGDQIGRASSFQQELQCARDVLSDVRDMNPNQVSLVSFDELFSSTNPEQGLYLSAKVLNALSKQSQMIILVSTHYDLESSFESDTNRFALMHMAVDKHNHTQTFRYQLKEGHSKQRNGLLHLMKAFRKFETIHAELKAAEGS